MDQKLKGELDIQFDDSVFWTDSISVLQYIRNETKRFHIFVANRLSLIHDSTRPWQWRYVNTKDNPADEASRSLTGKELIKDERWLRGPKFESEWPTNPLTNPLTDNDPEVSQTHLIRQKGATGILLHYFSDWNCLKSLVAWLLRFKNFIMFKSRRGEEVILKTGNLQVSELQTAEKEIVKFVQRRAFSKEIETLKSLDTVTETKQGSCMLNDSSSTPREQSKESQLRKKLKQLAGSLYKLNPKLIGDVLCIGGRFQNAPISEEAKHPIILPDKHHVTELVIKHYHVILGHSGKEHILSSIRQRFWITRGRVVISRVIGHCFHCLRKKALAGKQIMADLPKERLTPDFPAFTFVGFDYFGPLFVKQGRSQVKRYGCLFTCLVSRAVHMEIAHSLTDSFINALRRFICRRGQPNKIRSDNGTNFKGGDRELRDALAMWNQSKINKYLTQNGIEWSFNPPAASHMGGVWERMVRSVKNILKNLLSEQLVSDEILLTLMTEVEAILNSRLLTPNSDSPDDLEALTPNHLLLLRSNSLLPPGVFCKQDMYTRRRWRQVQYLSDIFWKRWMKEYIPSLQKRQRWVEPKRNLREGDLVLVIDENTQRGQWPLGVVVEVYPGMDGYIRSVQVKTAHTLLKRPVTKLCFLENTELSA